MYQSGLFFNVTVFLVRYDYNLECAKLRTRHLGLHTTREPRAGHNYAHLKAMKTTHLNVRFVHAAWDMPPPSSTLSKTWLENEHAPLPVCMLVLSERRKSRDGHGL